MGGPRCFQKTMSHGACNYLTQVVRFTMESSLHCFVLGGTFCWSAVFLFAYYGREWGLLVYQGRLEFENCGYMFSDYCLFFSLLHMIIKFRRAYVAPSSRVFRRGELVMDPKKIAQRYIMSDFFIDLVATPLLPQVIILKYQISIWKYQISTIYILLYVCVCVIIEKKSCHI